MKATPPRLRRFASVTAALLSLTGLTRAEKLLLLTADNRLVTVDSLNPSVALVTVPITGVLAGENLVGIDTRPKDGSLMALSSASRLYNIVASTGVATPVGTEPFTPALSGTSFGFDFNPAADLIRVVSDAGQNLRINPDSGAVVAADGAEAFGPNDVNQARKPVPIAAAYTGSGPDATSTQLYVLDAAAGVVALQNPPNAGRLHTVNALGVAPTTPQAGFDISNATERAYAAFSVEGVQTLFSINLATPPAVTPPATAPGAATSLGALPAGGTYVGLAVLPANTLRRQRAAGYVEQGRPIFADFVVGATGLTPDAGAPVRVLIRGLGPSLADDGAPSGSVLQNPRLRVFSSDGMRIAKVDDYTPSAELTATGLTPASPLEPAIILTLQPGSYSVQLRSHAGDQGTGRIELFELDQ